MAFLCCIQPQLQKRNMLVTVASLCSRIASVTRQSERIEIVVGTYRQVRAGRDAVHEQLRAK